ncbi:sulfotransferase [Devosia sp. PTR5]|uniref:Sulfotransferase n=1 Tax=Devosia oryzisoli TaxID=2774138 RepID=A0A927FXV6_9HYPH|nr:sulfotransferase [Devosia oryzisoli]MBD8066778.1 sulfotransferase [Devosia oryzisoli]
MRRSDRTLALQLPRPSFALARLLRRPSFSASDYAMRWSKAELARLKEISLVAQRETPEHKLLFVLGVMPRSGTNFLFELLCQQPRIARPVPGFDEFPFLGTSEYFKDYKREFSRFHPSSGEAFGDLDWMGFAAAGLRNFIAVRNAGAQATAIKEPHVIGVELFEALFPRDQCLLVLRDGRYIVDSYMRSFARNRFSRTFEDVCLEWQAAASKFADFAQSADPARVKVVRYEELDADRRGHLSHIMAWVGLELDADALARVDELPVFGSSTHSARDGKVDWTPVKPSADFKPTTRAIEWDNKREETFERLCGDLNRAFGY